MTQVMLSSAMTVREESTKFWKNVPGRRCEPDESRADQSSSTRFVVKT
jgi:hypothetical protein